jgi:hypothetical protein
LNGQKLYEAAKNLKTQTTIQNGRSFKKIKCGHVKNGELLELVRSSNLKFCPAKFTVYSKTESFETI